MSLGARCESRSRSRTTCCLRPSGRTMVASDFESLKYDAPISLPSGGRTSLDHQPASALQAVAAIGAVAPELNEKARTTSKCRHAGGDPAMFSTSSSFPRISYYVFRGYFFQKSPDSRPAPTHARHKRWHVFPERCVTLCHLRFCTTCAQVGAAKPNRRIPPTIVSRYNLAGPASNLPACNCSGGISKCVSVSPSPASFSS